MNIRPASGMVRDTLACRRQISYSACLMATNDLARSYSRPRPASTAPVRSTSEKQSWELSDADGSSLEDEKLVVVNVAGSKYPVVGIVAEALGMSITKLSNADCDLLWMDSAVPTEKYLELKPYQIINHFPGMAEICRKDSLGRNMQKLMRLHKDEYNFVPRTWVLPGEFHSLLCIAREYKRRRRTKTFIVKPSNAAMGNGIFLTQTIDIIPKDQNYVVQEYLEKPFLLDGYKIDLRVYVLVTSCNPLRIFVYNDGLVRLSTLPYAPPTEQNLDQPFMHLTNYSINKHSAMFDHSEEKDQGSKRTIQYFNLWLVNNGYSASELWAKINDIIVKTLIATLPQLSHSYSACRPGKGADEKSQCFEVLGFDILLDEGLNPWLLEVNRAPSFATESKLDWEIKFGVIRDALNIINIKASDRRKGTASQRKASMRRLLHTPTPPSRYDFRTEQDVASYQLRKRKEEVKSRLDQMRREKKQYDHEQKMMGGYVRAYPCNDWVKAKLYKTLAESAATVSLSGSKSIAGVGGRESLHSLKEHELLNLLSQYEGEERSGISSQVPSATATPSYMAFQPLSLETNNPMDAVYRVMAARVAEEEHTQRIMINLNEMKPSYPGKTLEETAKVLEMLIPEFEKHFHKMADFWLVSLDGNQRRQLLTPLKDTLKGLIQSHWHKSNLCRIRLYQIFNKLFNFMLSRGGLGIWTSIAPDDNSWEAIFKERTDVISVAEMVCCRNIVELSKAAIILGFYYHCLLPREARLRKESRTNASAAVLSCTGVVRLPSIHKSRSPSQSVANNPALSRPNPHHQKSQEASKSVKLLKSRYKRL